MSSVIGHHVPLGLHVSPQDGVYAGLIALLLPEPFQQIGIQPHRHRFFAARPYNLGVLPKRLVGTVSVGVGINGSPYLVCGYGEASPNWWAVQVSRFCQ